MRTLLSLLIGTFMLNMSVHAGSPTRRTTTDGLKALDENVKSNSDAHLWEKQEMEDPEDSGTAPGLEKNPKPYRPQSEKQGRIKTKD